MCIRDRLSSSLKSNTEIFAYPPRLVAESFSFSAYLSVLTSSEKLRYFFNSYLVALLVTLFTLIVGSLAGYSFSRYQFIFKRPLNMIIIGVQAVPPITLLIPYFGLIVALRLFNTYAALVLTYMAVSYTHLRAHETVLDLVCRLLLEKKNNTTPELYTDLITSIDHPHSLTIAC